MATPEAIHYIGCAKDISKSSRDRRKLGPDSTATQLQESEHCLDGSFSREAAAAISLQLIQAIKKKLEKSIAKALSIPRFQLQTFQCIIL